MSEDEFGPTFVTITDENGEDIDLEYVDTLQHDGQTYMAFFPVVPEDEEGAENPDNGLILLKSVTENGEEQLSTLDSDEELNAVYDLFMEQLFADEETEEDHS
jgi:uncharacterized protein YrzB (UPF0473 family)